MANILIRSISCSSIIILIMFSMIPVASSSEIRKFSDIPYGEHEKQVLDVYRSSVSQKDAPVIFMVHGGAWRIGDKSSKSVVENKASHWVPKGFVLVSVNYRTFPEISPVEQANDVAMALLFSQRNASEWGGSADKFILMGHSSGAHLVSLISTRQDAETGPWLGTVALDSAAYDVEEIMGEQSPSRLYKNLARARTIGEKPPPFMR